MIELPEFVTSDLIERTYARAIQLRDLGERNPSARSLLSRGMNMARQRYPKMLLFLEKGAEHLQQKNQDQQARLQANETGLSFGRTEFSEFATWRTAYEKAVDPEADERTLYRTWGWIYAAVAEALGA